MSSGRHEPGRYEPGRYSAGPDGTSYEPSESWTRKKVIGSVSALALVITIGGGLVIFALAALLHIGGFLADQANSVGTHVALNNAQRQKPLIEQSAANANQAANDNQGSQDSLVQEASGFISDSTTDLLDMSSSPDPASLKTRAIYAAGQACQLQGRIIASTPLPPGMSGWFKRNCQYGALSATSPIYQGKTG